MMFREALNHSRCPLYQDAVAQEMVCTAGRGKSAWSWSKPEQADKILGCASSGRAGACGLTIRAACATRAIRCCGRSSNWKTPAARAPPTTPAFEQAVAAVRPRRRRHVLHLRAPRANPKGRRAPCPLITRARSSSPRWRTLTDQEDVLAYLAADLDR